MKRDIRADSSSFFYFNMQLNYPCRNNLPESAVTVLFLFVFEFLSLSDERCFSFQKYILGVESVCIYCINVSSYVCFSTSRPGFWKMVTCVLKIILFLNWYIPFPILLDSISELSICLAGSSG